MGFANQITTCEFSREGSVGIYYNYANNRIRLNLRQILRGMARDHKKMRASILSEQALIKIEFALEDRLNAGQLSLRRLYYITRLIIHL